MGLNTMNPEWFSVGGPPATLRAISIAVLGIGIVLWVRSVVLIGPQWHRYRSTVWLRWI
jgi:hypothetical protein